MALFSCPECGHKVSEYADTCPNCGFSIAILREIPSRKTRKKGFFFYLKVALGVFFSAPIILMLCVGFFGESQKKFKKLTREERVQRTLKGLKNTQDTDFERRMNYYETLVQDFPENKLYKEELSFYTKKFQTEDTKRVLDKLKTLSEFDYKERLLLYKTLFSYHPNNFEYLEKVEYFTARVEEEKAIKEAQKNTVDYQQQDEGNSVKDQFSSWDGSHRELSKIIKRAMHDPGSYEHVSTSYSDNGSYIFVKTTYRGKNAFGALVKNTVSAEFTYSGNLIRIHK